MIYFILFQKKKNYYKKFASPKLNCDGVELFCYDIGRIVYFMLL